MGWEERLRALLRRAVGVGPSRLAIHAGLRAGVAAVVPLLFSLTLGKREFGWTSAVAIFVSVADKGGAYWTRLKFSSALTLSAAAAVALGAKLAPSLAASVAGMFAICLVAGLAAGSGDRAISAGRMLAISFAMSVPYPEAFVGEAWTRGLYALAGGVWAMALALSLWPLRFYRPAREAIASLYDALATKAEIIAELVEEGSERERWGERLDPIMGVIQKLSEEVREILIASRRGAPGNRRRGEGLLVLYEGSQRMLAILAGIPAALEPLASRAEESRWKRASVVFLRQFSREARGIGARALGEARGGLGGAYRLSTPRPSEHEPSQPSEGAASSAGSREAVGILFERLGEYVAATWLESVRLGAGMRTTGLQRRPPLHVRLRDQLQPRSPIFRHALRLATTASLAVALGKVMSFQMSQWLSVSVIAILHPHSVETFRRGLQRVGGAVLGGTVAAMVAASLDAPAGLVALIFVFAVLGVSCAPLNYGYYVALMTPTYVLLSELRGSGDWELAGVRIVYTLVGGTLALVGMRLFWPGSEWDGAMRHLSAGLSASGAYLEAAAEGAGRARIRACRRSVGLTAAEAEESLRRLLEGEGRSRAGVGPLLSAVTYLRRLNASITALASVRRGRPFSVAIAGPAHDALDDLAASVERGAAPRPLGIPWPQFGPDDPVAAVLQQRIVRQIEVLHRTVGELRGRRRRPPRQGEGRLLDLLRARRRLPT